MKTSLLSLLFTSSLLYVCLVVNAANPSLYSLTVDSHEVLHLAGRTDIVIPTLSTQCGAPTTSFPLERPATCAITGFSIEKLPQIVSVKAGDAVTFAADGTILYWATSNNLYGPAGSTLSTADIRSVGGISGYHGPAGALAGVFIGADIPTGTAPAEFNYTDGNIDFTAKVPLLNQIFYIGDGYSGSVLRSFIVPDSATRLAVGIVEAAGWQYNSGFYVDNSGSFNVNISVYDPAPACGTLGCQNGGVCGVNGICQCAVGWTGTNCQTSLCNSGSGCTGNSWCNASSVCQCNPGYFGPDCTVCPLSAYTVPKVTVTLQGSSIIVDVDGYALSFIDTQPTKNLSGDVTPFIPTLSCTRFVSSYWTTSTSNPCYGHLQYVYEFIPSVECKGVVKNTSDIIEATGKTAVSYTFPFQISSWTWSGTLPTSNDLTIFLLVQYYLPIRIVLPTETSFTQDIEMWHAFTWAGLEAGTSTYDADEGKSYLGVIASISRPYQFATNYISNSVVTSHPTGVSAVLEAYKDTCAQGTTGTCIHNFYLVATAPYCQVAGDYVIQIPIQCRSWETECYLPENPDDASTTLNYINIKVHIYQNNDCTVDSITSTLSSALTFDQTVYNQNEVVNGTIVLTSDITIQASNLKEFAVCDGTSACTSANRKYLISDHAVATTYGAAASTSFDDVTNAMKQKVGFRLIPSIFTAPAKNTKSPFYFEGTINGIDYETSKANSMKRSVQVGDRSFRSIPHLVRSLSNAALMGQVIHIESSPLDQKLGTTFNDDTTTFSGVMQLQGDTSSTGGAAGLTTSIVFVVALLLLSVIF